MSVISRTSTGLVSTAKRRTAVAICAALCMIAALLGTAPSTASAAADKPTTSFSFDFGSGAAADGYTTVECTAGYSPETGFGFTSTVGVEAKDRGIADPLLTDFCFGNALDFAVDLPNGDYTVRVIAGDATATQGRITASAEGETMISGVGAAAGAYVDRSFNTRVADGQLSITLASTPARMNALIITPFEWEPGLKLIDDGSGSIVLQNSHVSLRVTTKTAEITALHLNRSNPLLNYLRNGSGAYLANWSIDGVAKQQTIKSATYEVVQDDDERIEIVLTQNDPAVLPFELEVHIALDVDSQGLYYYTIYRYPAGMPTGLTIQQLRYAFKTDATLFTEYAIDDERRGVAPLETEFLDEEVQDATYRLPDGSIYSKYQQISDDEGSQSVFGVYGDGVGLSLVQPNKDWMPGGPTRQELTTHTVAGGQILLWHENSRHYGATDLVPEPGWEKVFGPFFLYIQEGDSLDAMWDDAKARLSAEAEKWPYNWISDPLYAAETRSDVTGRLTISDGSSAKGAWVLLTDPGADWQGGNGSYVYTAQAESDGTFTIPAVRPGEYTLHAIADGQTGAFAQDGIVVSSDRARDVGNLVWEVTPATRIAWRIGTPDRSAAEFVVPEGVASPVNGLAPWREYGTWLQYAVDFPEDVSFHVDVDDPAIDWPYFQPMIKTPGNPEELLVPYDPTLTEREILFDVDGPPRDATLTVGIASAVFANLAVQVNGERVAAWDPIPGPEGDNALYRHSDRGQARELEVEIPAELLREGSNSVTLTPVSEPESGTWTSVFANVMYDFVQLAWNGDADETPPVISGLPSGTVADSLVLDTADFAADEESDVQRVTIELDGETIESGAPIILNGLLGEHHIVVTAVNAAGLSATAESSFLVVRDDGATQAPGVGVLSSTSGRAWGLHDGNFTVEMNLWWGTTGSILRVYENGELLVTQALEPTTRSQSANIPVVGRADGDYVYTAELINLQGATKTSSITVTVNAAKPGAPVLSHDDWDGDGSFTLTADLWWGTNANQYRFELDGVVVGQGDLTARSPGAQRATVALQGIRKGDHVAQVFFINAAGETAGAPVTVRVTTE
ncbi:polysaccharide lyase family protein [Microbacterium sp. GXF0217]